MGDKKVGETYYQHSSWDYPRILVFLTAMLLFMPVGFVFGGSGTFGYCYQETANVPTACGGLNSGSYSSDQTSNFAYVNYSKPASSLSTSLWQVKHGGGGGTTYNISIPNSCFSQSLLQFRLYSSTSGTDTSYGQCYNGTAWQTIGNTYSGTSTIGCQNQNTMNNVFDGDWGTQAYKLDACSNWDSMAINDANWYEEAMYWNVSSSKGMDSSQTVILAILGAIIGWKVILKK